MVQLLALRTNLLSNTKTTLHARAPAVRCTISCAPLSSSSSLFVRSLPFAIGNRGLTTRSLTASYTRAKQQARKPTVVKMVGASLLTICSYS
eukprot:5029620-Pyramimonas_sp.AAC.1